MTDIVDPFAEGYKAPTSGIVDPFAPDYQPPKPRGLVQAFGAGVKETAGQAAQAAGAITGATGVEQWGREVRAGAAPIGEESTGAAVARAAGGLVGWLPAIAGTMAVLPEAGAGVVGGSVLRGIAGMALPAAANKVTTTADLKEKGVDTATAEKAGWASAATTAASGAVPLAMAGGLLKRAATGAVSGLVVGEASREAQNAVLVEHPELQTMVAGKDMVVNSVVGAMLGGILGPRPIKTEIANFKTQAEADVASGTPVEKPAAPAPAPEKPVAAEPAPTQVAEPAPDMAALSAEANRRAEADKMAQRIATVTAWREQKLASDIESTDARVEGVRLKKQATDRQNLMDAIYSDPNERTPGMTFLAALEREYPNKPDPTPREKAMIAKRESAYQAFNSKAMDIAPAAPNELVLAAKEKAGAKPLAGVAGDRARGVKDVTNMWDAVLKENEGATSSIKAQHIAEAVKEKNTITEQLAGIEALRKKANTGTDNKVLLDQLAVKLSKFRKEAPNAVQEPSAGRVLQRPQEGAGEARSERQRVEPIQQGAEVAAKEGNGPVTKEGEVVNEAEKTKAAQAISREAKQPEVPGESAFERLRREAAKPAESALGENIPKDQSRVAAEIAALHAEANRLAEAGDAEGAQRTAHRAMVKIVEAGPEYQKYLQDEYTNKAGEAFASRTPEQAKNPATKEQIDTEAAKIFGSKAAADRVIVHVTDPEKQIPAKALADLRKLESREERSITVAFAHNGKIYVMDNQIEAGTERAIILHEAGVHLGMERLIGKKNFEGFVNQIREWANGNGHLEDVALARKAMQSIMDNNVPLSQIDQETVAYFVQHALEAGINPTHIEGQAQSATLIWLRKIWAAMKTALLRLGIDPASLKAQDIVDVAHAAAIAHAEAIPGVTKETVDFLSPAAIRSARAVDFQSGPRQAVKAVDTVLTKATSLWDSMKPSLQRTHLNWSQMTHIADMTEHLVPMLPQWGPNAVNPVRDKVNAMLASGAIAKELNHAAQGIYDQMQSLAPKQKEALVQLMGKYQLAKVFPNLSIEDHIWLKPAEKVLYREAKQLYSQPGVAAAYDAARLHNQRLHDTGMASMLKSMAQIYGVPDNIWRAIDVKNGMSKEVDALLAHVKASDDHTLQDQFNTAMDLHEAKKTESYFSLGRDGDYMVNFHIKDTPEAHAAVQRALSESGLKDAIVVNPGDTHVFSMFETMNQMLAVTKQLDKIKEHLEPKIGEDSTGKPTASPYTAGLAVEKLKALDSSAPSFIRGMLAKIDADPHLDANQKAEQQELLRRMYINMLPESSVSKFYARRAGTPGYSSDMARSFVKRSAAGAYFTAQHATRPEQAVAMARLREAASELGDAGSAHFNLQKQAETVNVINELNQRTANMLAPLHTPMIDNMSAIGHAFYLSASPSFILQNLAQPYQLTLPYLGGRHGFRASSAAMGAAAKDVAKIIKDTIQQGWQGNKWTGVLDATITVDRAEHLGADDKAALKHLIASGRADWTQGGELTRIAQGENRSLETALKTANSLSYYGEVLNRMQSGLAAYRLELKRTGDRDKALDYMVRAVDDTQINYAPENRARALSKHGVFGQLTPMVMAFQQFNMGVLQLLGKLTMQATRSGAPAAERLEAAKSLGGILAATSVAAGTMGLPFAGVVMGAYNSLIGDENSPVDAKSDYQNYLTDIMGHDAAQIVAHGAANYVTGADLASKLGQENVIPFTGLFAQMLDSRQKLKDRLNAGALNFMGPVVNGGASVLQGLDKMADGDVTKGLEQMSPAMLKGYIKAADIANNGFTDTKGVPLPMEATTWDTVVQAAGFTPAKLATQREAQFGVNAIQNALRMRQQELSHRFVSAVEAGDVEARLQVVADAREFMRANPGMRVDFAGAMRKRAQEAAIAKASGTGVKGKASQMPLITQQTRFAQQP